MAVTEECRLLGCYAVWLLRLKFLCSMLWLLIANVPSSPVLVTLMTEVICPSDTSVLTRAKQRNFPEDGILHSVISSLIFSSGVVKHCYSSIKTRM
jgi:hypothetical protein